MHLVDFLFIDQIEPPKDDTKETTDCIDDDTEGENIPALEIEENGSQVEVEFEIESDLPKEDKVQTMADQEENGNVAAEGQGDAEIVERPKKNQTPSEPPVTFREFNVSKLNFLLQS